MNERVIVLRDAIVKITQILAGSGIEVTQRGVSAYVEADRTGKPIRVNLPYLPDNASIELCEAIQGFLDHEVAHIMFSDFSLIESAVKSGCKSVMNALEDTRIERKMAQRFNGSAGNLSTTGKFFLDEYIKPKMEEAASQGDANAVLGLLMVPLLRSMAGQHVFKDFMSDKMHIVDPIYSRIKDLEPRIKALETTQDCLEVAEEIKRRIEGEDDNDEGEDGPSSGGGSSGEGSSGKKGKSKGEGKSKPSPKPEKDEGEEEGEGEGESGGPAGGEDEAPEEDEEGEGSGGKGEEESPPEEGEGEGAGPEDEGEEEGEDEGEGEGEEEGGSMEVSPESSLDWSELDKNAVSDYDEALSELISQEALDVSKAAPYIVYSKDNDTIEPLHVGSEYKPVMFTSLAEKVEHMVGPLQKDLERAISARSLRTWEAGLKRGRINPSALAKLSTGDTRVFRKRHESTTKDVAVSLVIDMSGSMSMSGKIGLAAQSAYALSQVLERIGIVHEVICFTTREPRGDSSRLAADVKKLGRNFTRSEGLYMPVIKDFRERVNSEVKQRFGWLPHTSTMRNNIDGECVEAAARRLMVRREAGKVMIVLSDGQPACYGDGAALQKHLRDTVKTVTKAGVNVVGIGIQSDAVRSYYPKHCVIHNVSELPDRVMKELRHLLVS